MIETGDFLCKNKTMMKKRWWDDGIDDEKEKQVKEKE